MWGMPANPADTAAGILLAAFILIAIAWGFRTREQPVGRFFGLFFAIMGAGIVWWRVSCWTGHMVCAVIAGP